MALNGKLRNFLTLERFHEVEYHLNENGNNENGTEVEASTTALADGWCVIRKTNIL